MNNNGEGIYNTRITPFYHDGNTWFTQSKDGKKIYSLVCLDEGKPLPRFIEWSGNLPGKGAKMVLLQTKKSVNWKLVAGKVRVSIPKNLPKDVEALTFSFSKTK